jgi:hypothetical protein
MASLPLQSAINYSKRDLSKLTTPFLLIDLYVPYFTDLYHWIGDVRCWFLRHTHPEILLSIDYLSVPQAAKYTEFPLSL